ncbi:MAG TPA: MFS transporter [Chloroflexia bacterium]|nr:MFS transporter [Chloroflexia bacterium]
MANTEDGIQNLQAIRKAEKAEVATESEYSPPGRVELARTFRFDALAASVFGTYGLAIIYFPAIVARKNGAPDFLVSLVIAAPSIGQLSAIFWTRFTQHLPNMKVMFWFGSITRLSLALIFFAKEPLVFALVIVLCHTMELSMTPSYARIMQQVYPNQRRGELMGKVRVISSMVTILAGLILGAALEIFPYQWVYPGAALLGFASVVVFCQIRYREEERSKPPVSLRLLLATPLMDKKYKAFLKAVFLMGLFNLLGAAVFPLIMVDQLHVSNSFLGITSSIQSFVAILSYYMWGKFIDRHHPLVLIYITFIIGAVVILLYVMAWAYWFLIPVAILTGVSTAGGDLANINNAIRFSKNSRDIPHYMALYSSLVGVRGIAAPFLATVLLGFMEVHLILVISFAGLVVACLNFYRVKKYLV